MSLTGSPEARGIVCSMWTCVRPMPRILTSSTRILRPGITNPNSCLYLHISIDNSCNSSYRFPKIKFPNLSGTFPANEAKFPRLVRRNCEIAHIMHNKLSTKTHHLVSVNKPVLGDEIKQDFIK